MAALGTRDGQVVAQYAQGRCFEVVELAAARGPDERHHRERREQNGQGQHDEEDGHEDSPVWGFFEEMKALERSAEVSTVSEDNGIITAASSGLNTPLIASTTPTRL